MNARFRRSIDLQSLIMTASSARAACSIMLAMKVISHLCQRGCKAGSTLIQRALGHRNYPRKHNVHKDVLAFLARISVLSPRDTGIHHDDCSEKAHLGLDGL